VLATFRGQIRRWYNYKTTRLAQGRENSKGQSFPFENKDLAKEIRQAFGHQDMVDSKKAS